MSLDLASPWREFLQELDSLLREPFHLHCIGGFAIVAGYGLSRSTNDLDYLPLVPCKRVDYLEDLAGAGSSLAKKHDVHMQCSGVALMPDNYEERLTELFPERFRNLHLYIPDAYDLVLSKLTRNAGRDREDVQFLAQTMRLDPAVLRERYLGELRPIIIGPERRHDATIDFWIEDYFKFAENP